MTIPVSDRLSQLYVGNGTNKRFDFSFRVFQQEDETGISVRKKGAVEFETLDPSDYIVQINQDDMGGYITFNSAPVAGTYFYIAGTTSLDQLLDITNYDNFYPDAIERALDKLTALLQERITEIDLEKQSRILADLKYDALAMERENNLENRLTSYINAMLGVTNPAIFDGISDRMIITKEGRTQREFNESIPFWTDEFVNFMQETYLREEQIINHADAQVGLEKQRALIAESQLKNELEESILSAVAPKADKTYVDTALSSFQNGAVKTYPTLAAANSDIANIQLNSKISVLSAEDGGDYYKATANATSLTKSPYDALALAKIDATSKADIALNNANANTASKIAPLEEVLTKTPQITTDIKALATQSGYVDAGGNNATGSNFIRSDFIAVTQGQIVDVQAQGHSSVSTVATYNASKQLITAYTGTINTQKNVNFTVDSNVKFIRVSFYVTSSFTQYGSLITPKVYKNVANKEDVNLILANNNYVNITKQFSEFDKNGYYSTNGVDFVANSAWATFTPINLKNNQTVTVVFYGSASTAARLFTKNSAGTVTIVASATGSTPNLQTISFTATEDVLFWFNTQFTEGLKASIKYSIFKSYMYLSPETLDKEVPSQTSFDALRNIVSNNWQGKKIVWIGTSIPAFVATNGISYPYLIGQMLDCTMQNNALGESFITYNAANPNVVGAASYKTLSATVAEIKAFYGAMYPSLTEAQLTAYANQASYEKLIIGTNADLVVFDHMHNDVDKSYVTYDVSEINSTSRTSFYGAFNYIIERLYADNPKVRIAFVSCPNRFLRTNPAYTLEKFDAFRTALRNIALKYNAPFIDLATLSNTNQYNYVLNTTGSDSGNGDVIHPSVFAKARYASILAEHIRAIA